MNEFHYYGPPGTGKTEVAKRSIAKAASDYGADRVMVTSYTKAAAVELASRVTDIPKQMLGTTHALAYRALGHPPLAEEFIGDFNDAYPGWAMTKSGVDLDDATDQMPEATSGDRANALYQLYRAQMIPRSAWPESIQAFAVAWETWKAAHDAADYTDLIENALRIGIAPGNPTVMFADEAQDFTAIMMQLLRQWARTMEKVVFLGDDDQTIYTFTGANPENLIGAAIPDANKYVLSQSYRLPERVHRWCMEWISRVERRQLKQFAPRRSLILPDGSMDMSSPVVEGSLRMSAASLRYLDPEIGYIRERIAAGKSVMLLASCGYMLVPWIQALREAGLPYHNPYRRNRGDWNPLARGPGSAAQRVHSFLMVEHPRSSVPNWTWWNINQWTGVIRADGVLKRGAKKEIEELAEQWPGVRPRPDEYGKFFNCIMPWVDSEDQGIPWRMPGRAQWLVDHALPNRRKALAYAADIADKLGADQLTQDPRIIVGTIHSVKGGQADTVMMAPDLSREGWNRWYSGGAGRDELRRVFYVGGSRAFEELVLMQPASGLHAELPLNP